MIDQILTTLLTENNKQTPKKALNYQQFQTQTIESKNTGQAKQKDAKLSKTAQQKYPLKTKQHRIIQQTKPKDPNFIKLNQKPKTKTSSTHSTNVGTHPKR